MDHVHQPSVHSAWAAIADSAVADSRWILLLSAGLCIANVSRNEQVMTVLCHLLSLLLARASQDDQADGGEPAVASTCHRHSFLEDKQTQENDGWKIDSLEEEELLFSSHASGTL